MDQPIDETVITRAIEVLSTGGVIVYPTETVYGIGCDPLNVDACERVQHLKDRTESKPLLLLAASLDQVEVFAGPLDGIPRKLAERFWPGGLTMVIAPRNPFPPHLLGTSGGIAFRVTPHPIASHLARKFGCPIVSTSANSTGQPPVVTFEQARNLFEKSADMVIESPEPLPGTPSTVVDLTAGRLVLLREGALPLARLREVL